MSFLSQGHHAVAAILNIEMHAPFVTPGFKFVNDFLHFFGRLLVFYHFGNFGVVCKFGHDALSLADASVNVVDVYDEEDWSQD